jgi:gamma-glutamylcyclotransferase (GGCT)/AIG2-like uncharacterized protein YtfP
MRLHKQFHEHLHYLYSAWLPGYTMYTLGNYPFIVKTTDPSQKILIEVTGVHDLETQETINKIELDAGYVSEKIIVRNDEVTIFLFNSPANNMRIESGDWVTFFGL